MGTLSFGVGLFPTEPLPRMVELAKLSEELGYSHIWVGDSHLIWREAYVNIAAAALCTSKVKIGTGVTNPLTRHPSVVASAFATLEEMAPGRFIIGIGLGDSSVETMGLKPARLSLFERTLSQMRDLLAGSEVELESGKIHLKHSCGTKVPFYVAASGPRMLELAGRVADGVIILVGIDAGSIEQAKQKIAAGAKASGRALKDLEMVLWVPCAVSDQEAAKEAVKAHVARVVAHPLPFKLSAEEEKVLEGIRRSYDYYQHMEQRARQAQVIPDWLVDKFAIAGTRSQCRSRVEELEKVDVDQVAIIPYSVGQQDRAATLRNFASIVF